MDDVKYTNPNKDTNPSDIIGRDKYNNESRQMQLLSTKNSQRM